MTHENILVVKKTTLFGQKAVQGLIKETESYLTIIHQAKEFLPRPQMEQDENYKQIIPYLVFKYQNRYFLMQRRSDSSEQRLSNKFSLGIGGHMRQEDMEQASTIFDWAKREFHEEIDYSGNFSITTLGLLNDDTTDVGKVHTGLVLLLEGDSPEIQVRSELKSGKLLTLPECFDFYPQMETWSQIIFDTLTDN